MGERKYINFIYMLLRNKSDIINPIWSYIGYVVHVNNFWEVHILIWFEL